MMNNAHEKLRRENNLTLAIGIAVSLLVAIITLLFGTGDSVIGVIILLGIFGFVVLFFFISWVGSVRASRVKMIEVNFHKIRNFEKDLNNLKERFDIQKDIADLRSRVSFFEKMIGKRVGKKGAIDPRWIILIIILILLYLFLKQQGIL